jgi:phospholipid N-methyltransferase
MRNLSFLLQYITNPKTVGAIFPSSKFLALKMIKNIDFHNAKFIIEYGPGTGVFTEKLLKMRSNDATILLIEYNYEFYNILREKYEKEQNIHIIHGSAENIDKYMSDYNIPYADYIISGLPFASLPIDVSCKILEKTQKSLGDGGKFITFQYTLLRKNFIEHYFKDTNISKEFRNLPPAYIFSCSNAL